MSDMGTIVDLMEQVEYEQHKAMRDLIDAGTDLIEALYEDLRQPPGNVYPAAGSLEYHLEQLRGMLDAKEEKEEAV